MISLIIPVFNGEQTLKRCLTSVLRQSYQDVELILVDNGSADDSPLLLQKFAERYRERFPIRFLREENRGIAHARNAGLDCVTGEYITFIDQDDYIDPDYLQTLAEHAARASADIVVSGYCMDYPGGKKRRVRLKQTEWAKYMIIAPWAKLFRTDLVRKRNLRFLDVLKGEDVYFVLHAYNSTGRIAVSPYAGYHWVQNTASLSHTGHRDINERSDLLPLFQQLDDSLYPLEHISGGHLEYFLIKTMIYDLLQCGKGKKASETKNYYRSLTAWLNRHYPDHLRNPYVSARKPQGELLSVRGIVWIFETMRRIGVAEAFLTIYGKLPSALHGAWR
ncbi:MAG: glycosyltransferase family 2 protein [Lachnospiraceae bacterium]|nr:glycosyltransferase family 2 protein [Lachnospiraceae bacterium]